MKTVREILNKYFGKDYLRDIHTGDSIDMSSEIDQALLEIKEVIVPEEAEFINEIRKYPRFEWSPYDCDCGRSRDGKRLAKAIRAELLRRLEVGK